MPGGGRSLADELRPPLLVVTASAGDQRSGCIVGFFTQCSIEPERYLVCISVLNHTLEVAAAAPALAVHVLGAGQEHLARLFGEETGDQVDKFAGLEVAVGPLGSPIIEDCVEYFEARVVRSVELGDHVGFVLEPARWGSGSRHGLLRYGDLALQAAHPPSEVKDFVERADPAA